MQVITSEEPDRTVVAVLGELDVLSVPDLRLALHAAIDRAAPRAVVVDLAGLHFLDATGLGALVGAHRRALRVGSQLVLRNPPERVARLLAVTRLDRVLVLDPAALSSVA